MHALSKKLYYDVMKSGQEDTILESVGMEGETANEASPRPTTDVGCSTRTHRKTYAVQTQWSPSDKNFRNEYTNTENDTEGSIASRYIAVQKTACCANLAINRARSVQTSSVGCQNSLAETPQKSLSDRKTQVSQKVVEVRGFQLEKRGFAQHTLSTVKRPIEIPARAAAARAGPAPGPAPSRTPLLTPARTPARASSRITARSPARTPAPAPSLPISQPATIRAYDTKSTRTERTQLLEVTTMTEYDTVERGHETCNCEEYLPIPCKRGLTACRNFTLGTAEFRRSQNEQNSTKLIGGCRVPVTKNQKCRL
ncbi:hypothetical protein B5X24_HaOG211864 [Helicoverpa armigera]|nr:hypothetical protein B5X24_HaOG211864 [Helicoverpa armigera]